MIGKKVKGHEGVDRISDLPSSLIIRILSFLPTKRAVMASALSKRWMGLWTEVPVLDFELRYPITEALDFLERAISASDRRISKLHIRGHCIRARDRHNMSPKLDWLLRSVAQHVEYISFSFTSWGKIPRVVFPLSGPIYSCCSLLQLKLRGCVLSMPLKSNVAWNSLRVLDMGDVTWTNDIVAYMLVGCPSLESLRLRCFSGISRMDLTSCTNLKELVMENCFDHYVHDDNAILSIWGPHLEELEFSGYWTSLWPYLFDARDLVKANLNLSKRNYGPDSDINIGWKLLQMVQESKKLKVGAQFLEVLLPINQKNLLWAPLSRLKYLVADVNLCYRNQLRGLCDLLRSSKTLEGLVVRISKRLIEPDPEDKMPGSFRSNVKIVTLHGIGLTGRGFELVRILLKNLQMLEKIFIYPDQSVRKKFLFELARGLLILPRASPHAELFLIL